MNAKSIEYKGYTIHPIPAQDSESICYGGYEITRNGIPVRVRKRIFPGFPYADAAWHDSVEHAKTEIDNLNPAAPQ
jgi:hypothetical protein